MKTILETKMDEFLDIDASEPIIPERVEDQAIENLPVVIDEDASIDEDINLARVNLQDILEQGQTALDELCIVAAASQHPRAYEVVATMVKTLTDANMALLQMQQKKKELKAKDDGQPKKVVNNLFVGSTADLQKILSPRKPVEPRVVNEGAS